MGQNTDHTLPVIPQIYLMGQLKSPNLHLHQNIKHPKNKAMILIFRNWKCILPIKKALKIYHQNKTV